MKKKKPHNGILESEFLIYKIINVLLKFYDDRITSLKWLFGCDKSSLKD